MELHSENIQSKKQPNEAELTEEEKAENALFPWSPEGCKERMELINQYVKDVSVISHKCAGKHSVHRGDTRPVRAGCSLFLSLVRTSRSIFGNLI